MAGAIADRIQFHNDLEVMEVDFSDMSFADDVVVHDAYDELERRLHETDRKWFFLVHYHNCDITPEAWSAFATRGKDLNIAYSLGSVRFGAASETQAEIGEASKVEKFDANLVTTRDEALQRIEALRRARETAGETDLSPDKPQKTKTEFSERIAFLSDLGVMEVDLSDYTFEGPDAVNAFYNEAERRCTETRRKWFFMINYRKCRINPEAWFAFAHRGKRLNLGHSLGSVRYDASEETRKEISRRSATENFDPNLCPSREDALRRIDALRAPVERRAEEEKRLAAEGVSDKG